jgi:nucleoid-associated protein YgaU
LNLKSRLYLCGVLLLLVSACAPRIPKFRDESIKASERVRVSGVETLFPLETRDFYGTVSQGDSELALGETRTADSYYNLAVGKADILDKLYRDELKRRKEAARLELEMKRQAEAELKLQKQREREKAEELEREKARARKLEAERAEARRRADRSKPEKEPVPVSRHTVKRGETFPQIAAQPEVYGEASLWPLIYKANRDQISNPAVLWPGQVLRIPRNCDKSEITEARRFSSERSLR